MKRCNTLFRGHGFTDPKDEEGCIKEGSHFDCHEFIDTEGRHVEWEYDYSCTCGCWDDEQEYHGCMFYTIIDI